ncbi:hypothetical protein EVAR_40358_1 [Eumeta japonica]|uniref:Uncharacterized protein n=1 Tax=Eumeta variegata TaxID=151549 RepID=A0A4C1XK14_EUMVA|nr:hypothetical protein EVAR_40358_1 [Eumeta japonica]
MRSTQAIGRVRPEVPVLKGGPPHHSPSRAQHAYDSLTSLDCVSLWHFKVICINSAHSTATTSKTPARTGETFVKAVCKRAADTSLLIIYKTRGEVWAVKPLNATGATITITFIATATPGPLVNPFSMAFYGAVMRPLRRIVDYGEPRNN